MPRRDLPNAAIWAFEDLWDLLSQLEADIEPIARRELGRHEVRLRSQRALTTLERCRVVITGTRPQVARTRTRRRAERVVGKESPP